MTRSESQQLAWASAADRVRHMATEALTSSMRQWGYFLPMSIREAAARAVVDAVAPEIRRQAAGVPVRKKRKAEHAEPAEPREAGFGNCRRCGKSYALNTDGNVRRHGRPECPGSGCLPGGPP